MAGLLLVSMDGTGLVCLSGDGSFQEQMAALSFRFAVWLFLWLFQGSQAQQDTLRRALCVSCR